MSSGLKTLSKFTGLSEEAMKDIFEDVKANHKRLRECEGPHDFVPVPDGKKFNRQFKCTKCDGVLDSIKVSWYRDGLEHGKRQPE